MFYQMKEEVAHKLSVVLGMLGVGAFMAVVTAWVVMIGAVGSL